MPKALKAAIEANDPAAVRKALNGVKDINRKLPGANKPLLYACEKGADKVLEVLFEAGAIAEKRNTFPGDTPFAVAAQHEQAKVLQWLWKSKRASQESVDFAVENAAVDGRESAVEILLQTVKPRITIELFRLATATSRAPQMLKLLVKYGGDVNARHDTREAKGMTVLHDRIGTGKVDVIRTLVECGADVNARDGLGRTPLMVLAADLEGIEVSNIHAKLLNPLIEKGEAKVYGERPQVVSGLEAVKTLIKAGADAALVDNSGNDAIDHCKFEYLRCDKKPDTKIIETLRAASAKGSEATFNLFEAIKEKNLVALRKAIKVGADVNRVTPPPVPVTPLSSASWGSGDSVGMVRILLSAGADPNKYDSFSTPLIRAARSGNLAVVEELITAGADLHAVELTEEYPDNAYSAVQHDKPDITDYLKSLGAGKPKLTNVESLKPGIESWNDFSELLVKATVEKAAEAVANLIKGKAQLNVYGQSLLPGKQAYILVRPKGMNWCNVFQIMPQPERFEDSAKNEVFARELAKAAGASVLSIEYSDTSDAASVFRAEPDGKTASDAGWDRDTLEEMVGAMGDKAPDWAKKQLAKTDEDDPSSTERLQMLAEQEQFVVAAFWLGCEPGRKLDIDFTGYSAEVFDGVAFVST